MGIMNNMRHNNNLALIFGSNKEKRHCMKIVRIRIFSGVFSGSNFPVFGLNTVIHFAFDLLCSCMCKVLIKNNRLIRST